MRSPIGPVLIILGLATILVLVLVMFQTIGLRQDLDRVRADAGTLREEVTALDTGVTSDELERQLGILESGMRDWLIATGADGFSPDDDGAPAGGRDIVLEHLNQILEEIRALDQRIDEICEGVPVC